MNQNHRIAPLALFVTFLSLLAAGLTSCGIKPKELMSPEAAAAQKEAAKDGDTKKSKAAPDPYPHVYPQVTKPK